MNALVCWRSPVFNLKSHVYMHVLMYSTATATYTDAQL